MSKNRVIKFISDLLLGVGLFFIVSPLILYWFIHGDYDRYIWIINGPYPFSHFGGGPFQLVMYLSLFLFGMMLVYIGIITRVGIKR